MYVGILTGPFSSEPLEFVAAFAGEYGFGGLEIVAGPGSKHIDTSRFTAEDAQSVRALMEKRNLQISSVAAYTNLTDASQLYLFHLSDSTVRMVPFSNVASVDWLY